MSREQAIALARAKYAEHPGTFHKLQPLPRGDKWILGVWLTPICGWKVNSVEEFEPALEQVWNAFSQFQPVAA